jgi:hypothetical protein
MSLVKLIPRYFEATVNGIVFFIYFSACLWLVYKKKNYRFLYLCYLILYPVALPRVFIRSKNFLVESSGSFSIGLYHWQMGLT